MQSVTLFLHKTQNALKVRDQTLGLIEAQPDYPYHELFIGKNLVPPVVLTPELRKELNSKLNQRHSMISALAKHDMFRQICGNPFSIVLIAAIHSNDAIKKEEENELVEVYNRIKSEKDIILEDAIGHQDGQKQVNKTYENRCSLRVSTEMSFNLLEDHNQNCMPLL